MIKRQYDFHIYLQYRAEIPSRSKEDTGIRKVDIIDSVRSYKLTAGPDTPIRYMEMKLDRATVVDKYPGIIDNIVEGETRLIIDAVDCGTFIISKIWLDGQTYELVALGSESVITGTLLTIGLENIKPSSVAEEVRLIWEYSADWNNDYKPRIHFSSPSFGRIPVTINNNMYTSIALQLCALSDDCFAFFANDFVHSEINCDCTGVFVQVNDKYVLDFDYTSYLTGKRIERQIHYVVTAVNGSTCVLKCTDLEDYGDLSEEIKRYIERTYPGEHIYLKKQDNTTIKIIYTSTKTYAHYEDCMYYVRYSDIDPITPDAHYPDRSGQINLYTSLDDYNRLYSDFDRLMFEKASEISHKTADASSTVINRQSMCYGWYTLDSEGKVNDSGVDNMDNTNGMYSLDQGNTVNPYYTGGTPSIATYGVREGTYLLTPYFSCLKEVQGMHPVQSIVNNIVRRYRDPPQSISFTVKESKMDDFGYIGWERLFEPFSYATSINDDIHGIYLTNAHWCDGVEDKSLLRLSSYTRHYPEMTTTYTFGGTRESGLTQMIADINQRT